MSTSIRSFILQRNIFPRRGIFGRAARLPHFLVMALLLAAMSVRAQSPVQIVPQLIPPYTLQLSDYYTSSQEKLVLLLTNRDLNRPTISVRLRMTITGQSATIRSKDNVYYPPVNLDAGIPTRLSLSDLAPYFNPNNLDFQGITKAQYQQSGKLPEGFYQFCFEAVELTTGRVVSQSSCAMAWLSLSDPPLLNLPAKGENVSFRDPLNILFSWTPRNLNSPNSAFSTDYDFQLVEITDTTIDPAAAFQMAQPLYETTVATTTLLYGPGLPSLLTGKKYAWRVQAKARSGTDQLDLYRNSGYSEIYWFRLQDNCTPPQQTSATIQNGGVHITWTEQPGMTGYEVDYRAKDQADASWFSQLATSDSVVLYDVTPGKSYEYRVGGSCSIIGGVTYGDIQGFTVPAQDTIVNKNCGILPNINTTNQSPLKTLNVGDVFLAGDFPVKVLAASGQGSYTGNGYVTVPFLGQARVKVKFSNIGINTDLKLISGVVVTTFDSTEKQVANTDSLVKMAGGFAVLINELVNTPVDNDSLKINHLAQSILTAIDSLPPAIQDSIHSAVDDLQEAKTDYDHAKNLYDSLPDGPEKNSAKTALDNADSSYRNAQAAIVNNMEGFSSSAEAAITYPYYQPVLVHYSYNLEPPRADVVQVFSNTVLPDVVQTELKAYILKKIQDDIPNPASLVFDFKPASIQYNGSNYQNRILTMMVYKFNATSATCGVSDEPRTLMLNDNTALPKGDFSLKDFTANFVKGANTITLQDTYTANMNDGTSVVTKQRPLIVKLANVSVDLSKCFIKVTRATYQDKYCGNNYNLGATSNNETALNPGETLTLGLYLKQDDGTYTQIENPTWIINDNNKSTETVTTKKLVVTGDLNRIGVWPNADMQQMGIEEEVILAATTTAPPEAFNPGSISLDEQHLICTDTTLGKKLFQDAVSKLKKKENSFYQEIQQKSVVIHFEYNSFAPFAKDPYLNGYTVSNGVMKTQFGDKDLINIITDDNKRTGIISDAVLIERLNDETIAAIRNACQNKDVSGLAGQLLSRLSISNGKVADTLRKDILSGTFDPIFLGRVYVTILPTDDMTPYFQTATSAEIYITLDKVKAQSRDKQQDFFNETFAHELKHFEYAFSNPYNYVKWQTIRSLASKYGYNLGDLLDHNHPNPGEGCSGGNGHEMHNDENVQVCNFGQKFQND